jgi:hypothetical protein
VKTEILNIKEDAIFSKKYLSKKCAKFEAR